jgi:hypothetical protein
MSQVYSRRVAISLFTALLIIVLNSCTRMIINEYEAKATTTYTWKVEYYIGNRDKRSRVEKFASNSLENINGEKPSDAYGEADDKGLWWPKIPPEPTLNEIEDLQQPGEEHTNPELLRQVEYTLSYDQGGRYVTLPTNYSVYRQAVKASESGQALKLTLGINDQSVEKAEPI